MPLYCAHFDGRLVFRANCVCVFLCVCVCVKRMQSFISQAYNPPSNYEYGPIDHKNLGLRRYDTEGSGKFPLIESDVPLQAELATGTDVTLVARFQGWNFQREPIAFLRAKKKQNSHKTIKLCIAIRCKIKHQTPCRHRSCFCRQQ